MHYKKIFIYIILVSTAFMQSQYNYGKPENIENGDARSMGIGNTYLTLGSNSAVTSINPARLAYISKNSKTNILIDFQLMSNSYQERRSQVIMDDWEEHLNYADYVVNQHSNFYNSFGLVSNFGNFGFGLSKKPLRSMNYTYEEEVRSQRVYPDGYIGMKDPIMGYHVFKSRGTLYLQSFGLGYSLKIPSLSIANDLAIGFSYNVIDEENLYFEQYIDTLHHTFDPYFDDNFDNFEQLSLSGNYPESSYKTASIEIPIKDKILLIIAYEDNNNLYFNHKKSIGMNIVSQKNMLMSVECNTHNSLEEYKIGFEYAKKGSMPLRMGFNWRENWHPSLNPISTLTLGTGKTLGNLNIDIGLNYKIIQQNGYIESPFLFLESLSNYYNLPDFNVLDYYDINGKLTENDFNILMTMTWSF